MFERTFIAIALTFAACAGPSTTIEQSWTTRNPQVDLGNVVTMYVSADGTMRRTVEDQMAAKLARKGIRAMPSYAVLSESDLANLDQAKAKLRAAGFDGLVAIRLVSKDTELNYVPGSFDGYWGPAWTMAYDPGYVYTETIVRIETSAYSLLTNQLVWSAISKTVDADDDRAEAMDEVTSLAAKELEKRGVVAAINTPPNEA
jgi:hypothetical protein